MMERFDHFMAQANATYYATQDPFKNFTTAPELTQVFGEILGAWAKTVWQMMGAPDNIILAEAGPGRGTLMADALRLWPRSQVHLIENSPRLRAEQATRVPNAIWHESLDTLPDGPLILLANEFLDALPVRQFIRRETSWCELYVENGVYREQEADIDLPDDPIGSIRERNEATLAFCRKLAARDAVALFLDYGPMQSAPGSSVQAIRDRAYADPLEFPGQADLTAHVDFAAIAASVENVQGPVKQNVFLTGLGLFQRSDFLARKYPDKARQFALAAQRLTAPEAMGSLFKAMALCPKHLPRLPGFEI